jgi:hypothetical protein
MGFEDRSKTPVNRNIPDFHGNNFGNTSEPTESQALLVDPDLAKLAAAWSRLPSAVRTGIIAMVRSVSETQSPS